MRIKQSVCLPMFKHCGIPMKDLIAGIAGIGYAAVEIWGAGDDLDELVGYARDNKLALASMIGGGELNNRSKHDEKEEALRDAIDLAATHAVPGLIVLSGNKIAGQSTEQSQENCAAILKRVAPYAEEKGVNLNLELLNSKVNHPGYECDRTAWGVKVCELVGSPRVKLLYDIYHMQIMEGDIIRTIREQIGRIGHFHTAGNPGRNDLDDFQELNYTGICRAIYETGYDLYVAHEFTPKGDVLPALEQAFVLCDV
jgi:hydroxypyruvate isomerase